MKKLGVFDSGLGGFNVVTHLRAHRNFDIVFLADHKNLPYGNKDKETLVKILIENIQWFKDKNIMHVLIACNTASNYIEELRSAFPEMQIDSIIEITAAAVEDKDLVIFGTAITASAKKYDDHMKKEQRYHPLKELASLVEKGDDYTIDQYLKDELERYQGKNQKYLLACTHYSIVEDVFEKYLDGEIYDSIGPITSFYDDFEGKRNLEIYSSGNIKILSDQIRTLFNCTLPVWPHKDDFTIVLVSDNHGMYQPVADVLNNHPSAQIFIHCGDVQLNDEIMDYFYTVNGNNDFRTSFPDHICLSLKNQTIYITHGDEYLRVSRLEDLYEKGRSINASAVFYGHEHIFKESWIDGMLLLNPGSLFYNRDNTKPSYALVHVKGETMRVEHIEI